MNKILLFSVFSIFTLHVMAQENPVSREQVSISNVTFEPRCRNNWHIC